MTLRCNHCSFNGRLSVTQTVPFEDGIWRRRVCPDCGEVSPSVERIQPAWPDGLWAERSKTRRAGKSLRIERDPVVDHFPKDAGASIADVMAAFARPRVTA